MTKTPEQMAVDWYIRLLTEEPAVAIKEAYQVGYQAAKDETNLLTSARWISVKERLPEDHIYYLVTSKKEATSTPYGWITAGLFWDIEIAYFHQKNETWMTGELASNCKEENKVPFVVSHWMPLPKPPEDK